MKNTGSAGETSTVNGYAVTATGSMPQTTSFGGFSRVFDGASTWLQLVGADANMAGFGTDFSKAVAFKVASVAGNAIIYMAGGVGGLQTLWRFEQVTTDMRVQIGDGSGSFDNYLAASGLTVGTAIGVSFSFVTATKAIKIYVNGLPVLGPTVGTLRPGLMTCQVQIGGSGFGQIANGDIAAPTGWTRILTDAEHLAWWNGGNVLRLP